MFLDQNLSKAIRLGGRNEYQALFATYDREQILTAIKNRLHEIALFDNLAILNCILENPEINACLHEDQNKRKQLLNTALKSSSYDFVKKLLDLDYMVDEIKISLHESLNLLAGNIRNTSPQIFDAIVKTIEEDTSIESSLIQFDDNHIKTCPAILTAHVHHNHNMEFILLNLPQIFRYVDEFYDTKDSSFGARDMINRFIPEYFNNLNALKSDWDIQNAGHPFDINDKQAELGFLVLVHLLRTYPLQKQILAKESANNLNSKSSSALQVLFNKFKCSHNFTKNDIFLNRIQTLLDISSIRIKATANFKSLLNINFNNNGVNIPLDPILIPLVKNLNDESNINHFHGYSLRST